MSSSEKQKLNHEKTSQTCDVCKLRHQKCNGVRPSCYYCLLRGLQCNYSRKKPRRTDQSDARRKSSTTEPLLPISSSPQTRPPEALEKSVALQNYQKVHDILTRELASLDLPVKRKDQLSRAIAEKLSKQLDSGTSDLLRSSQGFATEATSNHLAITLGQVLASELGLDANKVLEIVNMDPKKDINVSSAWTIPGPATSPHEVHPNKFEARAWVDAFLNGPNKLFYVCDPLQSHEFIDALYDPDKEISPISNCLVSFQIALGALFTDNISDRIADSWYDRARRLMEDCIENEETAPLWIIQALLLSTIYSMNSKPKMCWLSLSSAIRLAQTYRIDLDISDCNYLTAQEYLHWRQVWLSIMFLDVWLAISLGRTPQITENTTRDPFLRNPSSNAGVPDHSVNVNMARLAVITGRILRDIYAERGSTFGVYESTMQELEEWSKSLPPNLRFRENHSPGVDHPGLSTEDYVSSCYLEIYYLASITLLGRPLLLRTINPKGYEAGSTISLNLRYFAQNCTDAAIQLGQVSSVMVKGGFICKRSWLVTMLNYHAALLVGLSLSGKRSNLRYDLFSTQDQNRRHIFKSGLEVCIGVLAYCGQQDPFANHYTKVTKTFQDMIEAHDESATPDQHKISTSAGSALLNQLETHHSMVNPGMPISEQASYDFTPNFSAITSSTTNSSPLDMRAYPSYTMAGTIPNSMFDEWTGSSNEPQRHLPIHSLNQLSSHSSASANTHTSEYTVNIDNPYLTWEQPKYSPFDNNMEMGGGNLMPSQNDMSFHQHFNQ
ncbi:hypothetical protein AOQ84DRAFT_385924 [Glonium stellatum]|uniref:Zn(2)-C6 fungal-type domain-containing protein n=1 Tax=Glonium stellatum TaxID=574774 RepID=A0A8E2F954_9PEZI|nr:hypothetical protein AOQ84DRAFT_385924 [Glonium stellatum]